MSKFHKICAACCAFRVLGEIPLCTRRLDYASCQLVFNRLHSASDSCVDWQQLHGVALLHKTKVRVVSVLGEELEALRVHKNSTCRDACLLSSTVHVQYTREPYTGGIVARSNPNDVGITDVLP